MRGAAKPRVNTQALIPQRSGVGDLRHCAAEKDGGEIGDATDMAHRLQDQSGRLPATRRAAIDADVGTAAQKRGLRSGLRGDFLREWKCHISRLKCEVVCSAAPGSRLPALETMALASAAPLSRSSRQRLRSVFGEHL